MIALLRTTDQSTLLIDAVVEGEVLESNVVTQHPVESGASIADHSQPLPLQVSLRCVFSETPPTGASFGQGPMHVEQALAWLRQTRRDGLPVLVQDGRRPIPGRYLIAAVSWRDRAEYAVPARIQLQQLLTASTATVELGVLSGDARADVAAGLAAEEEGGDQPSETLEQSTLDRGLEEALGIFGPGEGG